VRNVGPRPGSTTATTTFEWLGTSNTIPSRSGPRPATRTSSPGAIVSTGKRYRADAAQRSTGRCPPEPETTPAFSYELRCRRWWISIKAALGAILDSAAFETVARVMDLRVSAAIRDRMAGRAGRRAAFLSVLFGFGGGMRCSV